jgi:hypothetical protein
MLAGDHEHEEPILQADQVEEVHEEPCEPGEQLIAG